jgi:hypothetical protein
MTFRDVRGCVRLTLAHILPAGHSAAGPNLREEKE